MMINVSIVWYFESLTNTSTSGLMNLVKTKSRSQSTVLHSGRPTQGSTNACLGW